MARLGSWIEPFPEGIYVKPADAWVDPSRPKAQALVTHGHADHARGGHGAVWATPETLAIMETRYGEQPGRPVQYGDSVRIGEVDVSFVPAGHVLGSAQIVLEYGRERVVVSGDYKRRPDPTCAPFVVVPCDIFITEATFGLPVFRHPDTGSEIDRLLHRLRAEPERCVLVGAYALGKAQRVIMELRGRGHDERDGLRLDANPPAGAAAECRAATGHLRPCRLGRAHPHHPRGRAEARLDHSRPRGRADALVHDPPDQGAGAEFGRL